MRSPQIRLAAAAALLAALAGCTQTVAGRAASGPALNSPPAGSPAAPPRTPAASGAAAFGSCADVQATSGILLPSGREGGYEFGCARVRVPLDYAHPAAGTLALQVFRVHDTAAKSPRTLFVDPGGPGVSAVAFLASFFPHVPTAVKRRYDLVAFDPRGTELSDPVRCLSDRQRDAFIAASPDVTTPSGFAAAKALAAGFVRGCARTEGRSLGFFDTVATARDMDRVRAALGLPTVNYLGFSYGTTLGSVYAHLFPRRVGAEVLDGAVDPLTSGIQQAGNQLNGFEQAFDQFAAWCAARSSCAPLGNARTAAERILAAAARSPLPTGGSRTLTPVLADTGMIEALYSESLWPALAAALAEARAGSGRGLLALADAYYQRRSDGSYATNLFDAFTVISCNDSPPGPTDAAARAAIRSWVRRFPLFGKWSAPELFMCQSWPVPRTVPPRPAAATRQPVLVLGNLHDPATPYQGAKDLARTMGHAEVLTWNGEGHTSYLEGSRCVDRYVDDYLVSGDLPPGGTVCS